MIFGRKNIARIANGVICHSLLEDYTMNIKVVLLNCQKCNVYLFTLVYSRKALGLLLFEVLHLSMCLSH